MSCQLLQLYICLALLSFFLFISKKCLKDLRLITDWFCGFLLALFSASQAHDLMQSVLHVLSICAFRMSLCCCFSVLSVTHKCCHIMYLYVIDTEPTHAAVCFPVTCELLVHLCICVCVWVCVFESAYDSSVLLSLCESLDVSMCITWDTCMWGV